MTERLPAPGVLPLRQQLVSTWQNGGGLTRELDRSPTGDSLQFDWRVSVAEVSRPGAFSLFPGVDRSIMVLSGGSMQLTVDGRTHTLKRHAVFKFSGDSATTCLLPQGPTQDLNVMTNRCRFRSTISLHDLTDGAVTVSGAQILVLLSGTAIVSAPKRRSIEMGPLDAVIHHPVRRAVTGEGLAVLIHLHRTFDDSPLPSPDAVVLSNHGGRQLDQAVAPLDALPAVREAVGDGIEVLVDSGIRRAGDQAIALARGASGALVGLRRSCPPEVVV